MKTKLFYLGLCAMMAFASCSKDDDKPAEEPKPTEPKVVLSENFDTATEGTATDACGTVWTGSDNFPDGSIVKTYHAAKMVKAGTKDGAGYIETKVLDLSAHNGAVTIKFKVKGWYKDAKMVVTMGEETQTIDIAADKAATELIAKEIKFTKGTKTSKIKFETGKVMFNGVEQVSRFFIDDLEVIN